MKIKFKKNPIKESDMKELSRLIEARQNCEPGTEGWSEITRQINILDDRYKNNSVGQKIKDYAPAIAAIVGAGVAIYRAILAKYMADKAYEEESEGNLKNGDLWRMAERETK